MLYVPSLLLMHSRYYLSLLKYSLYNTIQGNTTQWSNYDNNTGHSELQSVMYQLCDKVYSVK